MTKPTTIDFGVFYDDALAYLKYSIERKVDPAQILNTMIHDISGLARKEICFRPQVSGWAKAIANERKRK